MLRESFANFLFDRNAWVVAYLLAETSQRIEKRGFAAVGISDHRIDRSAIRSGDSLLSRKSDMGRQIHGRKLLGKELISSGKSRTETQRAPLGSASTKIDIAAP